MAIRLPTADLPWELSGRVNFAKMGDPNGTGLPEWSPYDLENEPYMEFGDEVVSRHHLLKPQLDFLERFQRSSALN